MADVVNFSVAIQSPPSKSERTDVIVSQDMTLEDFFNDDNNNNDTGPSHISKMTQRVEEVYDLEPVSESPLSGGIFRAHHSTTFRRRVEPTSFTSSYNSFNGTRDDACVHEAAKQNYGFSSQDSRNRKKFNKITWNKLNTTLFFGHALLSAATSVPVTLIPTMARSFASSDEDWTYYTFDGGATSLEVYDEYGTRKRWIPFRIRTRASTQSNNSASSFASRLAVMVTLATACGKFVNGPLVDISGARRLLIAYGMFTSCSLVCLRHSSTAAVAIACCSAIEFFSSVFWPCAIVVLGAHYGISDVSRGSSPGVSDGRFERALNLTSISSRCGSLVAMPLTSLLLKWSKFDWRDVAGFAALSAFTGVIIFYFYLSDSPSKVNDPQNPIRMIQTPPTGQVFDSYQPRPPNSTAPQRISIFLSSIWHTVHPSLKTVIASRVFWILAVAHTGATMVKSSERILGTYYCDTSYNGIVTEEKAGAMTVCLTVGMLGGLVLGGRAFARSADEERLMEERKYTTDEVTQSNLGKMTEQSIMDLTELRPKNMIAFLYCLTICMSYMLSFLAMPFIRRMLHIPAVVLILQVLVTMGIGAGVAVQYYHIPAIVGATYGSNRGLYMAYTDGVAALLSSLVWRIVGRAVEEGDPQGYGWAYGWAAVALLLIFCGTLMVGIMEVYFVGGGWRHHLSHYDRKRDEQYLSDIPQDLNRSWMEEEIQSTGLSLEGSTSGRRRGGLHLLSSSAIEFLSPSRTRRTRIIDEEQNFHRQDADLLGIDDDGSVLYPINETETYHVSNGRSERSGSRSKANDHSQKISLEKIRGLHDQPRMQSPSNPRVLAEYISFDDMLDSKKCQITFTNSEDGDSSIRQTSCFDYPDSTIDGAESNNSIAHQRPHSNKDYRQTSAEDSFEL